MDGIDFSMVSQREQGKPAPMAAAAITAVGPVILVKYDRRFSMG